MQTVEYAIPEGLLRFERTLQEISWLDAADENWRFTDANGHKHAFADQATAGEVWRKSRRRRNRPTHYPTLRLIIDRRWRCYTCDPAEPHWVEETHYECLRCGETIKPGHGPGSKMIPVSEDWTLTETTDQPTTEWLEAGFGQRMEHRSSGVRATRTRRLVADEGRALLARHMEAEQQAKRAEDARRAASVLGYPRDFA